MQQPRELKGKKKCLRRQWSIENNSRFWSHSENRGKNKFKRRFFRGNNNSIRKRRELYGSRRHVRSSWPYIQNRRDVDDNPGEGEFRPQSTAQQRCCHCGSPYIKIRWPKLVFSIALFCSKTMNRWQKGQYGSHRGSKKQRRKGWIRCLKKANNAKAERVTVTVKPQINLPK